MRLVFSLRGLGLGTNLDQSVQDLRHGVVDPTTGRRTYMLSGALGHWYEGKNHVDDDLIEELSNRLHGRVSDFDLAAIAAIFRKALGRLEKEKRQKAWVLLDQMTGRNGHE